MLPGQLLTHGLLHAGPKREGDWVPQGCDEEGETGEHKGRPLPERFFLVAVHSIELIDNSIDMLVNSLIHSTPSFQWSAAQTAGWLIEGLRALEARRFLAGR